MRKFLLSLSAVLLMTLGAGAQQTSSTGGGSATSANQLSILNAVQQPAAVQSGNNIIGGTQSTALSGAYQDGWNVNQGQLADLPYTGSGNGTETAVLKGIYGNTALNGTAVNQVAPYTPVTPGTATATKALLLGGHYNGTSLPSFTTGQEGYIPVDQNGALNVGFDGVQFSPATVTSATTVFTQDMTGYAGISVQTISAGTGNSITFETAEDNSTYVSSAGILSTAATNQPATTTGNASLYMFPKRGKWFRARVSTYTSGNVTIIYSLHKSFPGLYTGTNSVQGTIASGATQTASPVPTGFDARTSNLTPVTNGQNVYGVSTAVGAQVVYPWSIPEATWSTSAASGGIVNLTTGFQLQAAGASGVRNYLTKLTVSAHGTVTTASEIVVRDGASGTIIWREKLEAAAQNALTFDFSPPLRGSTATLMEFATLTAMGAASAVYVNAQGYQGP